MTITAKFASKCASCGGHIQPGTQIEWSKGQPARHTDCGKATSVPAKATRRHYARCADCGAPSKGYYRCYDCSLEHRDGGSMHRGGQSYIDRNGNFVLGDDD